MAPLYIEPPYWKSLQRGADTLLVHAYLCLMQEKLTCKHFGVMKMLPACSSAFQTEYVNGCSMGLVL